MIGIYIEFEENSQFEEAEKLLENICGCEVGNGSEVPSWWVTDYTVDNEEDCQDESSALELLEDVESTLKKAGVKYSISYN